MKHTHSLRRRGGTAAIVGLSLTMLLGFAAFGVDMSYLYVVDVQLRAAVDAAASGGAGYLDATDASSQTTARTKALQIGDLNKIFGSGTLSDYAIAEVGEYDRDTNTFTVSSDPDIVNAVRVTASYSTINPIFASAAFGVDALSSSATAIATRDAGGSSGGMCYLPFGVPLCMVAKQDPPYEPDPNLITFGEPMTHEMIFSGSEKNAFYICPEILSGPSECNASSYINQLFVCTDTGTSGTGSNTFVGDLMHIDLSVKTSVHTGTIDAFNAQLTDAYDDKRYGAAPDPDSCSSVPLNYSRKILEGPVPIFGHTDGVSHDLYCDDYKKIKPQDKTVMIYGIAWGAVYDVLDANCGTTARSIAFKLDTVKEHQVKCTEVRATGPDYGVTANCGVRLGQ